MQHLATDGGKERTLGQRKVEGMPSLSSQSEPMLSGTIAKLALARRPGSLQPEAKITGRIKH